MFNRIVVPLDGTPFAEAALAPACELARAFHSRLVVVRAIPAWGLPHAVGKHDAEEAETALELLDDADAYLHGVVDQLQRDSGLHAGIALYIAESGTAIARAAELDHADLIVMTAHPRWRVDVLDNRSTTLQVLARTRVSILAWRFGAGATLDTRPDSGDARTALPGPDMPILVPLDGSLLAETALPIAESLARTFGSYLVLVRAVQDDATLPTDGSTAYAGKSVPLETRERVAAEYLSTVEAQVAGRGLGVTPVVRVGSPTDVIEVAWHEQNAGLIVMATHGMSGTPTSFLGSVSARTIEEVGAPVLVVRPEMVPTPNGAALHAGQSQVLAVE